MTRTIGWLILFLFLPATFASGETIEMTTYYPSPGVENNADRFHTGRATIGDPYSLGNPLSTGLPNGTLLVGDRLGVGTATPAGPLHVVGRDDVPENVLFMPGADTVADAGTPSIRIGVGTAAPESIMHLVTEATDETNNVTLDVSNDIRDAGGEFVTRRSRGTSDNPAAVQVGDDLGGVKFMGYAPGGYALGASIDALVDGPPAGVIVPAALVFRTSLLDRLHIRSNGNVGVGTDVPDSRLQVNGSMGLRTTTVADSTTLDGTHNVVLCNNGANITLTLPAAAGNTGRVYVIKKISNNVATVTIDPNGAETIDGAATMLLDRWRKAVRIICDGTGWHVISGETDRMVIQFVPESVLFQHTGPIGWTTVDVSALVPANARGLLVYCTVSCATTAGLTVRVAADASSYSGNLFGWGNAGAATMGFQATIPLSANRTFMYYVDKAGSGVMSAGATLIGYYT